MRVLVTGAGGFLGWHTCVRLKATTDWDVVAVTRTNWTQLPALLRGADAVVHLAGVNRGTPEEVEDGNVWLAWALREAVLQAGHAPVLVFGNTTQVGNGTPYGRGKESAASILERTADEVGGRFVNVEFPNLFGEHGRPDYNSFVATFAHAVMAGEQPVVVDRQVELLHVQAAARELQGAVAGIGSGRIAPRGTLSTVEGVLTTFQRQHDLYRSGDIPPLTSTLERDLFNQLRSAMFPQKFPMPLVKRTDKRGDLVEMVRAHGGGGQTFFSTTEPGITRGQHFHMRKVERFVVVQGEAEIALRRVLTDDVVTFRVNGTRPVILDMPTFWVHNITNTADRELLTMFWTNELFDPQDTDTYPMEV